MGTMLEFIVYRREKRGKGMEDVACLTLGG